MINAQDNVEKCVTFVLAHLFAFATAFFCIVSNSGGFICPAAIAIVLALIAMSSMAMA